MITVSRGARVVNRLATGAACLLLPVTVIAQTPTEWPVESPPAPLAQTEVQFPPKEVRTLANGMNEEVVLKQDYLL